MNFTKILPIITSIIAAICFILAIVVASYVISYKRRDSEGNRRIRPNNMTISQGIAYGNRYVLLPLLAVSLVSYIITLIIKKPIGTLTYVAIPIIVLVFALISSLSWITPEKDLHLHYLLAGIIFSLATIGNLGICITWYLKTNSKTTRRTLVAICILIIMSFIGLAISFFIKEQIPFASFENLTVLSNVLMMLAVGILN